MLKWLTGKTDKGDGVKSEPAGDVRLSIILAGDELLPCDIEYMDKEGGRLSFPEESSLHLSRRVRFKFSTDNGSKELTMDAIVLESRVMEGRRVCQFRFAGGVDVEAALGPGAFSRFNRRRGFRVVPDGRDRIEIELTWGETNISGRLADISVAGMGIDVTVDGITVDLPSEVGETLVPLDRVTLSFKLPGSDMPLEMLGSFKLPGSDTPLKMLGTVRNRNLKGKNICYGIDFEWDPSDESQRQAKAVRSYVMRLQRSMLEQSAKTRRG